MSEGKYDVIVVGGGYGGVACAALLAKRGLRTLLVEKNDRAGGKALTVSHGGFKYELWPVAGSPAHGSLFEALLKEIGAEGKVELITPEDGAGVVYRPRDGDYRRPSRGGAGDQLSRMIEVFQLTESDVVELGRVMTDINTMPPEEIDKLDLVPFSEFLARYDLPESLVSQYGMQMNIIFVAPIDLVPASEAIRVFQDFNVGGSARHSAGGYGRVAEVCAEYVASRPGCDVRYHARVDRVLVEEGAVTGVATEAGTYHAPIVISNAGIQPTVLKLVGPEHFNLSYVNYVKGLIPSWGLMGIRYFIDKPIFDYPLYIAYSDDSYWTVDRFAAAQRGEMPDEVLLFLVIPSLFDPSLAPAGKQCVLASTLCSPDPHMDPEPWWRKVDEMMEKLWPEMKGAVESKEPFSTQHVSVTTRDSAVVGAGGECIGLGQIVGQCGKYKPSAQAPVRGLFYVGCDAGGYGCGTHQAVDSGFKVAEMVYRHHRQRLAFRD